MPMYDFLCPDCGAKMEKLTKSDVVAITCDCGGLMQKQLSAPPVRLDGTDPSLPGAYDRWARVREQHAKVMAKKEM